MEEPKENAQKVLAHVVEVNDWGKWESVNFMCKIAVKMYSWKKCIDQILLITLTVYLKLVECNHFGSECHKNSVSNTKDDSAVCTKEDCAVNKPRNPSSWQKQSACVCVLAFQCPDKGGYWEFFRAKIRSHYMWARDLAHRKPAPAGSSSCWLVQSCTGEWVSQFSGAHNISVWSGASARESTNLNNPAKKFFWFLHI